MSWTMVVLIPLGFAAVALGACLLLSTWCLRRTPPELRGDWWPQFESEFRAYAERAASAASRTKGRTRDGKSPPADPRALQ
ncbi:MAG: hypothetical protein JOZ98_23155 [Solirubrobacterales bacterium]|nr:hypothetical protein [Solirubrobacterales bacterium]MBV9425824.1 hypothetical protein [Solirubrobacterales bacterium]MBV9800511.1 hypothetical protein [Solirubrobacterales bacterium]